jgi:hypothetical protein
MMKRHLIYPAVGLLSWGAAAVLTAQTLDDWAVLKSDTVATTYQDRATGTVAVILAPTPSVSVTEEMLRIQATMLEPVCPGISAAGTTAAFGGRGLEVRKSSDKADCRALAVANDGTGTIAVSMAKIGGDKSHDAVIDRKISSLLRIAPPRVVDARAGAEANTGVSSDAALKAYVASIPASRRPIKVATRGTHGFSGYPAVPTYSIRVFLFFANGYATDCSDWDPGKLEPTPASLGAARSDCSVYKWRQGKAGLEIEWRAGDWGGGELADDVIRFRPGERISIAFGNIRSMGVAGPINTGTMSGGDLMMRPDGQFASGDWSTTTISGQNVAGYSAQKSGPTVGRYHLDGNIIAVDAGGGRLNVGFITGVRVNGQLKHIYLNGTHFWDRDD